MAFDGGEVFVLHFQHDVDLLVLQLFVESQESLQVDRIGVSARPFAWRLLGVMNFLVAVACLPGLCSFGDPMAVIFSGRRWVDGMVQVVVDGRNLESVRQSEDLFDVVEAVVIFDDEAVLDGFRQAAEILFEALKCFFFITVDASDMQDDFVLIVDAQTLQHFGVVREIEDSARHDILVGRIQDGVLARMERHPHAALPDLRADVLEVFGVDVPPGERVDRAGAERDQIRADAEQFDIVFAVVVDHLLQRGEVVCGHFRQLLRGRVALHHAADIRVGCADVEAGIADGYRGSSFRSEFPMELDYCITFFSFWSFLDNPSAAHQTSGYHWLRWRHRLDFSLFRLVRQRRFG